MNLHHAKPSDGRDIEVFFDGACPLCAREIRFIRRLDRKKRIQFTDIASQEFRASDYQKTMDDLMSEINGRLPDGTWVVGVEVFRRLYAAVGLGPLVWLTRLTIIAGLLDRAYGVFARNRLRWTSRCESGGGTCRVGTSARTAARPGKLADSGVDTA